MRYLWQAIGDVLRDYGGEEPLALYLKGFFRGRPKLGSRDRRVISDAVYCWYRAVQGFSETLPEEVRLQACLLLCGTVPQARILLPKDWLPASDADLQDRLRFLEEAGFPFSIEELFPHRISFSKGVSPEEWKTSLLQQPMLFLRLRVPLAGVEAPLRQAGLQYSVPAPQCLALPNGTDIKDALPADSYVVQDLSSQRTGDFFHPKQGEEWWDACAGAGGKSILLKDLEPGIKLTATDIRPAILHNLTARLRRYGLKAPEVQVLDAADAGKTARLLGSRRFDAILTDVPCTGSGTWGRTPEGAYFFDPANLARYTSRQLAILRNVVPYLKPGGRIVYATCSVFREENEGIIETVCAEKGLRVESSNLISGLEHRADSLFAAVLRPA